MSKKKMNNWSRRFAALAMALMVMIPMMTGCTKPRNGSDTSKKTSTSQTQTEAQRREKKKKDKEKNKPQQNNRPGSQTPEEKRPNQQPGQSTAPDKAPAGIQVNKDANKPDGEKKDGKEEQKKDDDKKPIKAPLLRRTL